MKRIAVALVLATLALTRAAAGEGRAARLAYTRGAGAEQCPDERDLRDAVVARLGYDPFTTDAALAVSVAIHDERAGLAAEIEIKDATGARVGGRRIASPKRDCTELGSAIALAVGLAIDPLGTGRSPSEASTETSGETRAPPEAPRIAPTPSRTSADARTPKGPRQPNAAARARLEASVGAVSSFGSAPAPTVGATLQIGARWRSVSLGLEGRADLPASETTSRGTVGSGLTLVSVVPCGHYRLLAACALASAGALDGAGSDVDRPKRDVTFFAAAGGRLAFEPSLTNALGVRAHADLLAPLVRTTLRIDGTDAWTVPPLSGALGLALIGRLP